MCYWQFVGLSVAKSFFDTSDPKSAAFDKAIAWTGLVNGWYDATVSAALLVDGEPAQALLDVAGERDADLVVIGALQDTSLADRLLGTVATEVVRRAPCEVLIVRPRTNGGRRSRRRREPGRPGALNLTGPDSTNPG